MSEIDDDQDPICFYFINFRLNNYYMFNLKYIDYMTKYLL